MNIKLLDMGFQIDGLSGDSSRSNYHPNKLDANCLQWQSLRCDIALYVNTNYEMNRFIRACNAECRHMPMYCWACDLHKIILWMIHRIHHAISIEIALHRGYFTHGCCVYHCIKAPVNKH